jgi:hypothetical protein
MDGDFGNGRLYHCGRGARVVKSRRLHRVRVGLMALAGPRRFGCPVETRSALQVAAKRLPYGAARACRRRLKPILPAAGILLRTACIDRASLAPRRHRTCSPRNAIRVLLFRHRPLGRHDGGGRQAFAVGPECRRSGPGLACSSAGPASALSGPLALRWPQLPACEELGPSFVGRMPDRRRASSEHRKEPGGQARRTGRPPRGLR